MAATFRCRVGRHRWEQEGASPLGVPGSEKLACRDCGKVRTRRKTALCYVGLHNWVSVVNADQRYLACRYCGKYGGDAGAPWRYSRDL